MNSSALRTLIIYAVILPLAIFLGWMAVDLARWDRTSFAVFVGMVFLLLLPALLKWHYWVLILSWNSSISIFFLPGKPSLWMLTASISFSIAIVYRIIQKRKAFLPAPSITLSLLVLLAIVLITGNLRGGFGVQALGASSYGGKAYYYIIASVIGYFALVSQPIPIERVKLYVGMYFLPSVIFSIGSTLIYYAGQPFYFLYMIFPTGFAGVQAASESSGSIVRVAGLSAASMATSLFLMATYGIRGILRKWYRVLLLLIVLALGAFGGYRSLVMLIGVIFIVLFLLEGLLRSPVFPVLLLFGALAFLALMPISSKLPLSVQRTLSFLPLKVNPMVRMDAEGSIDWRVQIWQTMIPDLPKYLWLGKGYALNPTDMYLTEQAMLRHRARNYEGALLAGDYHNGPLSVYVPFGSFGALAFLAFLITSARGLYLNYRYGHEALRTINRFLLAYFCGRVVFFFVVFGSLHSDLAQFVGIIGLSVALNKGISRRPVLVPRPVVFRGRLDFENARPRLA